MARSTKRFNPTGLEATLLTIGGIVLGGVAGFFVAGWACTKVLRQAAETGAIDPSVVGQEVEQGLGEIGQDDDEIVMVDVYEFTLGYSDDGRIEATIYDPEGNEVRRLVRNTLGAARRAAQAYAESRGGVAQERPYVAI
jgi:hypothetical protein